MPNTHVLIAPDKEASFVENMELVAELDSNPKVAHFVETFYLDSYYLEEGELVESLNFTETLIQFGYSELSETLSLVGLPSTTDKGSSLADTLSLVPELNPVFLERSLGSGSLSLEGTGFFYRDLIRSKSDSLNFSIDAYYLVNDDVQFGDVTDTRQGYSNQGGASCRIDLQWISQTQPTWKGSIDLVGKTTLTLPAPEYGDTRTLETNTIRRTLISGVIQQFNDPDWNEFEGFRLTFADLSREKIDEIDLFLVENLGLPVTLNHYDGGSFNCIITDPGGNFVITARGACRYQCTISLETI